MTEQQQPGIGAKVRLELTAVEAVRQGLLESMFTEHTGWGRDCSDQARDLTDNSSYRMEGHYLTRCVRCVLLAVRDDPQGRLAGTKLVYTVLADIIRPSALTSVYWD